MKKISKIICIAAIAVLCLSGCAASKSNQIKENADLNGRKMGCMSGSIFDMNIEESFPDSEIVYFQSRAVLLLGLKSGKIDGYLADEPVAMLFKAENEDINYLNEPVDSVNYGICFSSDAAAKREQFDAYLGEIEKTGHLKELQDKWIRAEGLNEKVIERNLSGENGTLTAVTTPDAAPFSFFKDQQYQGYEVELLTEFCEQYGYSLEITGSSFDALLSSVASNKFDIAFNGIYITEERKKSVDFCNSTYTAGVVPVIRSGEQMASEGVFASIANSFRRTFIEEDRWKLIISGGITTLIITLLSLVFGSVLGFFSFFFARKSVIYRKIAGVINYIITGLPVVLFLMILFYIVFSKSSLSGTVISVIGFSIIECTSVYDMLKTGTSALDNGQYEAALALGNTDTGAYLRILFPQTVRIILPAYRKEIVTLVKATAIVGYVTVQDLTRVSDIIRSRTYDAFFPLIVTAIIYFLLAIVLVYIVDKLAEKVLKIK